MQNTNQTIARFFSGTKALLMLAAVACALTARSQIVTFDATTNSEDTVVEGISPAGAVTGAYYVRRVGQFGFLRTQNGQIVTFGPPTTNDLQPEGLAINSAGEVMGSYNRVVPEVGYEIAFQASFLRLTDGDCFNIDPTNAYTSEPFAMNEKGTVAGTYGDASDGSEHFFLRDPQGVFTEFDLDDDAYPVIIGLNSGGDVTGSYYDESGNLHGFVRTAQGEITSFDDPDAVYGTDALSINPSGQISGMFFDASNTPHGFVLSKDGQFTTFDPQGSTGTYPSSGCGNAPNGEIAGSYTDASGVYHGFLRTQNGNIITFDPQGSTGTFVAGINAGGVITGFYNDASGLSHGFEFHSNGN